MSSLAEKIDETTERGVHNARVVDLISFDKKKGEVEITMIEIRPWATDTNQLVELQEKFNNYLDYVLDGHFAQQYPQYQGKPLKFCLACATPPEETVKRLIGSMEEYLHSVDIGFVLNVDPSL